MKKLLAIVMVVAMMFSMSVVAMADENPWTASVASVEETADGLKVTLSVTGDVSSHEIRVYYSEGTEFVLGPTTAGYVMDALILGPSGVNNDVADEAYYVQTGAGTADQFTAWDGAFCYFTVKEACTIDIVDGVTGVKVAEGVEISAAPEVTETPEPTDTPAPATATPAPATDAPEETEKPAPVDPTKAPTTPSDDNKTEAPKTADVAPVATMITLVVVAGLAIVALKKRATN